MPTILIIDDEEGTRNLARMILTRHGFTVLEEPDAQSGIATARRQHPDLILMDISMPLLDGWTATRVLKSDPTMRHVPIVAWTALNIGGEEGARAAGYDGYLPKPVELAYFVESVNAFLPASPPKPYPSSEGDQALPSPPPTRPLISLQAMAEACLLLLIEDAQARQVIQQQLAEQGYRHFIEAIDLAEAGHIAQNEPVDLILLDMDRREKDGLEVLRQLRANTRLENTPIIALADAHTAQMDSLRALELGADDCLVKPVHLNELTIHVSSRLRIKLLEDNLRRRQSNLEVLYRASQLLGASLDPATVLALILEQATTSVEAIQGSLYMLDTHCRPTRQLHTSGAPAVSADKLAAMFHGDMVQWACSLLEPTVVDNTPTHPHGLRLEGDTHTFSSLVVPLVGREGVMGILSLDHDEAEHFTSEHIAWISALTAQAGVALDNARLFEQVRNERRKLSAILDSSADGILVVDDEKRIALLNAAAASILGLGANAVGHPLKEVVLANNPLITLFDYAQLRQELVSLEIEIADCIYHTTIRPVRGVGYVTALHDVHLLKELEDIRVERARQETERVRREFARHVSPQVMELLLQRGESLATLRKCKAVVLFSDLRNYTALTERIGIEAVAEYVLKRYLTVMTDMIYRYDGTINKILGDGIMAVFGVPIAQDDAPQRAMRTAVAMQRGLALLRAGWLRELNQDIYMGIGLAWGEVIAGNIGGSSQRVDYTVVGDAVNMASRLGDKAAPGEVLLAQSIAEAVGDNKPEWWLEALPPMEIKGKEQLQHVYRAVWNALSA